MTVTKFGTTESGQIVHRISLSAGDLTVSFLTLGAILQDVRFAGADHSLTLGSENLGAYEGPMKYYGAIVGPVANRIAKAQVMLENRLVSFTANENGITTVHGGPTGTHAQIWTLISHGHSFAEFRLQLRDAEGGFPGNRVLKTRYDLASPASLTMTLTGTTDRTTFMNLANHSYWNLDGGADTTGHRLQVLADHCLPTDEHAIPTRIMPVAGTEFDFRSARPIGAGQPHPIDHNLCLARMKSSLRHVATLWGKSGICLSLDTTETGLQIYDARKTNTAPFSGFHGQPYGPLAGIALEPQGWPDAPNRPDFPPVILKPSDTYKQTTRWRFNKQQLTGN